MTRKEIMNADPIAFIDDLGGLEFKHIEYGDDDYIYCVSDAWYSKPTTHKAKIHYASEPYSYRYIVLHGQRFNLDEAIRL